MNKMKKYIALMLIFALLLPIFGDLSNYVTYAAKNTTSNNGRVNILKDGEIQYLVFNVSATPSDSRYRYRTKGWNIKAEFVVDGATKTFSGFYKDSQLEEKNNGGEVWLKLKDVLNSIGVTQEFERFDGTLYLNAGQVILVDGKETSPTYNNYSGIVNGITSRYGISWSKRTLNDLKSYYGLDYTFEPVAEEPIPTSVNADFNLLPEVYEYQDVGYKDISTAENSSIQSRKLTISGPNGYIREIENQVNPSIKLAEGDYIFVLNIENEYGDKDIEIKQIRVIKQQVDVPSKAIAVINSPNEVPINQSFAVSSDGSFASTGAKITEYKWYVGTDINNLAHDSTYDNQSSINVSYSIEGVRYFKLWIRDTSGKEAYSNIAITQITDNTPTSVNANVQAPDIVYEGVPFQVTTYGSSVIYGDEKLTPKEAVEKNIAKYSYKFSCSRYGRLGPDGGKVYLEELGTQTIQYKLRARKSSDVDIERVIVLPTPHTIFSVSGTKKVNRKLIIDTTFTKAHIEYPIDESKTIIKIKDLSNGQTYEIIGEGDSINTNYIKTLKYKNGKLPTTIKRTGDYEITVTKQDTRGKTSTQKQTITIKEDLRPIADFIVPKNIFRNSEGKAVVTINKNHNSPDNDIIGQQILKYRYDTDNDGKISDENFIYVPSYENEIEIELNKVGEIEIDFYVKEDFDYIPEHVSDNDFLSDKKTEVVKIDNIAPVTSLDIIKRKPIDMLFLEEENELQDTISATDLLKEELNNRTDIIVDVSKDVIDVDMSNEPVTVLDEIKSPWYLKGRIDFESFVDNNGYVFKRGDYIYTVLPPEDKGYFGIGFNKLDFKYKLEDVFGTTNIKSYKFKENGQWFVRNFIIEGNIIKEIDVGNGTILNSIEINESLNDYEFIIDSNKKDILRLVSKYKTRYIEIDYENGQILKDESLPGKYFGAYNNYVYSYKTKGLSIEIYKTKNNTNTLVKKVSRTYEQVMSPEDYSKYLDTWSQGWPYGVYGGTTSNPVIHNGKIAIPYSHYYGATYKRKIDGKYKTIYRNNGIRVYLLILDLTTENIITHTELNNDFGYGELKQKEVDSKIIEDDYVLTKFIYGDGAINPVYILNKNCNIYFREDSNYSNKYDKISYELVDVKLQGSIWSSGTKRVNTQYDGRYGIAYIEGVHFKNGYKDKFYYSKKVRIGSDESYTPTLILPIDTRQRYAGFGYYRDNSVTIYDLIDFDKNNSVLTINFSDGKILEDSSRGKVMPIGSDKIFVIIDKGTCVYDYSKNETIYDIGYTYNSSPSYQDYALSPNGKYLSYLVSNYYWEAGRIVHYKLNIGFYEDVINKLNNYNFRDNSENNLIIIKTKNSIDITQNQINDICNIASNKNAKIIFLGSEENRYIGEQLASSTNGVFMTYTNLDNAIFKLKKYVESILTTQGNKKTIYVKKGETIIYEKHYSDYENDPEHEDGGELWKYTQDLSYPHPDGIISYNEQWLTSPKLSIDKSGRYFVTFLKKDNPSPGNDNYDSYRKWSNENPTEIIVYDGESPPVLDETVKPKIFVDVIGDLRVNHRVDFIIIATKGSNDIDFKSLDISFDRVDYLPYTKPNTMKFSRVFKNTGAHSITVTLKDVKGKATTITVPFTIGTDNLPIAGFNITGDSKRNEEGYSAFKISNTSVSTDDEIGKIEYFREETKYILDSNENLVANGKQFMPISNLNEIQIYEEGRFKVKQVVEDYYINGIGLNGEDLDSFRVFKKAEIIKEVEVINEAPTVEYTVAPMVIQEGDKIKHIVNLTDDTPFGDYTEYYFTHDETYYQNNQGKHELHNVVTDEPLETLNKKGKYDFYVKAHDEEGKMTGWVHGGTVFVCTEPKSDFELLSSTKLQDNVFEKGSTITVKNKSYNNDYGVTVANQGIDYYKLEYKKSTDAEYTVICEYNNLTSYVHEKNLSILNEIGVYEVKQTVGSPEGFFDEKISEFIVLDLKLNTELEPNKIYSSQSYKIKARLSKDGLGAVAYIPYSDTWVTLNKVNEDTNYRYYEIETTTEVTLPDNIYDIEVYALYPYNLELKETVPLTVNTPVVLTSDIKPIAPTEYSKVITDNNGDNDYIQVPASEKIKIEADLISPLIPKYVKAKFNGDSEVDLTYNSTTGKYELTLTVPSTKPDKDYYDLSIATELPNGNKATNSHKIKVETPIELETVEFPNTMSIETNTTIKFKTSKYVDKLQIILFANDDRYKTTKISPTNISQTIDAANPNKKIWTLNYYVPVGIDEGRYRADITAYAINHSLVNPNKESLSIEYDVINIIVTGHVNHTEQWEENRIKYNISKTGDSNRPRNYDVFFPGEKFILKAETNVLADSVIVKLLGTGYSTSLTHIGSNIWEGYIWNEEMLKWDDRTLTFEFIAYKDSSESEPYYVEVKIVDDDYWRLHRKY